MNLGYASPSSDGEGVAAQSRRLTAAGCAKILREAGGDRGGPRGQLRKALDLLEAGDVLIVTRLDCLARSTRDLLDTLVAITERKAGFRSLDEPWADTTTRHGRVMLTVLAGLAEFERELIRARTGEGRARAVARGVKMGRPPKLTSDQRREAVRRRARGEPLADIALGLGVSAATISRLTAPTAADRTDTPRRGAKTR